MKYKAVFFDLDGTLINTLEDLTDAMNHALSRLSLPTHSADACRMMIGNGVDTFASKALGPDQQDKKDELIGIMSDYYHKHCMEKSRPYEGIKEVIDSLKNTGIYLGVITNKEHIHAVRVVEHYFGSGIFYPVVGINEETPIKPDPTGILRAMETLNMDPVECILVGDSDVDIQTGLNAGIRSVGVSWGFREEQTLVEAGAARIIDSPGEILDLLT